MISDEFEGKETFPASTNLMISSSFPGWMPTPPPGRLKLSGGNIQKVLLGREIEMHPRVLVTAYPFRGLDVGASNTIYAMLNEQKCKGVAVLLIGEDLDVLRGLSDRLMVIHNGRVMGIVNPRTESKDRIGIMMMGGKA